MANSRITLFLIIIKFNFVITGQPKEWMSEEQEKTLQVHRTMPTFLSLFLDIYSQIIHQQGKNSCKYKKSVH